MKAQQQAAQQQAQQQAESQMQLQAAQAQLAQARATADTGLGMERMSRIQENQALAEERRAQAVKDDYQALLNYAKALKEIEDIDLGHLEKIIILQKTLKDIETQSNNPQPLQDRFAVGR
jgi:hypothetical protein